MGLRGGGSRRGEERLRGGVREEGEIQETREVRSPDVQESKLWC